MKRRAAFVVGIGLSMALGETLAALALSSNDVAFLALQACVAFAVGCAVFFAPLPLRALAAAPLGVIGLFHGLRVLHEGEGPGLPGYALLAAHFLATLLITWRLAGASNETGWSRRELTAFATAYAAQALWIALLVIPVTLCAWSWKVGAIAASATVVPLFAGACARAIAKRGRARSLAALGLFAIALAPFAVHKPWRWAAHEDALDAHNVAGSGPDVLFVILDTVRADRTSVYGNTNRTTPNLERFAETATVYERAQSQGIWTLPSHASLFTGLYPSEHGADWLEHGMNAQKLSRDAFTLAERFKLAGYRTGCIASNKAIFGADFGLMQGFDTAWAELGQVAQLWVPFVTSELVHKLWGQSARQHTGALEQNQFAPAQEINALAFDWLERTAGRAPRFLFLNYMEAHGQLRRPPCDAPLFGDGEPFGEWDIPGPELARVLAGTDDANPLLLKRFRDWYDCQVACLDQHVGELFDELRARGLFDELLIVVTADHGHMLGEHRAFKHQAEIWQGLVGVPLLIKLPRQKQGSRCGEVVQTSDVVPALVRWLDLPVREELPTWAGTVDALAHGGVDITPLRDSAAPCPLPTRSPVAISEAGRMGELASKYPERFDTNWTALYDGAKKYVVLADGSRRVADLASDADETLRELTPEEAARCDELLAQWRAGLLEPLDTHTTAAEEARRLRALQQQGYVGK